MEFEIQIFQAWEIVESGLCPGKSWEINPMVAEFLTWVLVSVVYIIVVCCQTRFGMGQLPCHEIQSNYNYFEYLVKVSDSRVILTGDPNRNGHKLSWKVQKNAHKRSWKIVENHFQCSVCTLLDMACVFWCMTYPCIVACRMCNIS